MTGLVFVPGLGFHTKPYRSATTTALGPDGLFSVLLATGGIDERATFIAVLVVPVSATVACYLGEPGIPAALEQLAVAQVLVSRPNPNQREVQFAGETWVVQSSPVPVGPGSNYFSDSGENVWIENPGRVYGGQPPPTDSERLNFRFNFWLINGYPQSDGKEAEIVVSGFSFVPVTRVGVFSPVSSGG